MLLHLGFLLHSGPVITLVPSTGSMDAINRYSCVNSMTIRRQVCSYTGRTVFIRWQIIIAQRLRALHTFTVTISQFRISGRSIFKFQIAPISQSTFVLKHLKVKLHISKPINTYSIKINWGIVDQGKANSDVRRAKDRRAIVSTRSVSRNTHGVQRQWPSFRDLIITLESSSNICDVWNGKETKISASLWAQLMN